MIRLTAEWRSHGEGQSANWPLNLAYQDGVDIDFSAGRDACDLAIDYPAPCVGAWFVSCALCGMFCILTAAGRPDDPRSVRLPCMPHPV
jgi:hypothetical protein